MKTEKKPGAIVLLSGGMDSVVALHYSTRYYNVILAVSFDYASKHNARELPMAAKQASLLGIPHEIVDLKTISRHLESSLLIGGNDIPDGNYAEDNMAQTVVPFRNGIMLSVAAAIAESHRAQKLVLAAHAGDHALYPDCTSSFMKAMGEAIKNGTYDGIEISAPFILMSKSDIASLGNELEVDFSQTWSCYKGADIHCGTCGTCMERKQAFIQAGLHDPTCYATLN